ncbi:Large cysteine-rich periplasmic protein OmcB [Phycisphaerales bacterium]|nr:Large cysteine-rich periplasmic protein OmcB [Phycisphaerales bacterium]
MKRRIALSLAALAGSCFGIQSALAQLTVGNDQTSPDRTIWLVDVTGVVAPRMLVTGTATSGNLWGVAADEVNQILYWNNGSTLYKAVYDLNNPLVPILIGTTTGTAPTGLAYDSVDQKLYARGSGGFYELDINTGAATIVFAATAQDFGGFDYDTATDSFFGTNDSTSTTLLPGGRGLYRINKPLSAPTFIELADYPNTPAGVADADIDGLASGGGKLYLVNDVPSQGAYVWNLGSATFEANLALPYTGTNGIFSGGAWTPGLFIPPTGADVAVSKVSNPSTLVIPPGGDITYTVTVRNNGPELATGVAMTDPIPAGMTFVSVDGGATFDGTQVNATIGDLTANDTRVFNIVVHTDTLGQYQNTASVSSTSQDNNPNNNSGSATTTVRAPLADLGVSITDPADCAVGVGGTLNYSVVVTNNGPESAENTTLVVTLPEGVTFISSNPPLTPVGSNLTLNAGSIGNGGTATLTIDATADSQGTLTITAQVSTTTSDPIGGNDTASENTQVQGTPPATADAKGIFSTIAASSSSLVPGLGGARFGTGITVGVPVRSPDGSKWIQAWDTDIAVTTQDQVLLLTDNGTSTVVVQEGVTPLPAFQPHTGSFDAVYDINNAGQFVFSGLDDNPTTSDGYVNRGETNGTFTNISQEGATAPGQTGGLAFGTIRGSASLAADGSVAFLHNITGLTTTTDEFTFKDSGATTVTQEQTTLVTTLDGSGTVAINDVSNGSAQLGIFFNSDHSAYCLDGSLTGEPTTSDTAVVVSGQVRIQEGFTIPNSTFTSLVSSVFANRMESDGTWFVRGDNADNQDWVVRNGDVIARGDDPIHEGATELFDDAPFANGFFVMASNNAGRFVVGGTTNAADGLANAVIVFNNSSVLLRENDPVDLDNNGQFDDGYYIRTFIDDRCFMTDTDFYIVVRLRDAASANCGATDTDRGQALIRIALPPASNPCDFADANCDGAINGFDVQATEEAVNGDFSNFCLPTADINGDGAENGFDVEFSEQLVNMC